MTFGDLLGAVFGPLAAFVEWAVSWVPRYVVLRSNERGVRYVRGCGPREVLPGVRWYLPATTEVVKRYVCRDSFQVHPVTLETKDGLPCSVGLVVVYSIVDVVRFEAENVDAEENMAEAAEAAVRDVVMEHTWKELTAPTEDGRRLHSKLVGRVQATLGRYGVEVESARPTDQVRMGPGALRVFGVSVLTQVGTTE